MKKVTVELTKYVNDDPSELLVTNENNEVQEYGVQVDKNSNITGLGTTGSFINGVFFSEDLEDISKLLTAKNVDNEVMYNEDEDMIKIVLK